MIRPYGAQVILAIFLQQSGNSAQAGPRLFPVEWFFCACKMDGFRIFARLA